MDILNKLENLLINVAKIETDYKKIPSHSVKL